MDRIDRALLDLKSSSSPTKDSTWLRRTHPRLHKRAMASRDDDNAFERLRRQARTTVKAKVSNSSCDLLRDLQKLRKDLTELMQNIQPPLVKKFDLTHVKETYKIASTSTMRDPRESTNSHAPLRDDMEQVKSVVTRMVTERMMNSAEQRLYLLKIVCDAYGEATDLLAQRGLRYRLVFKGGNIFRMIFSEFVRDLRRNSALNIKDMYARRKLFDLSDFDFELAFDERDVAPEDRAAQRAHHEAHSGLVHLVSYRTLEHVRRTVLLDQEKLFRGIILDRKERGNIESLQRFLEQDLDKLRGDGRLWVEHTSGGELEARKTSVGRVALLPPEMRFLRTEVSQRHYRQYDPWYKNVHVQWVSLAPDTPPSEFVRPAYFQKHDDTFIFHTPTTVRGADAPTTFEELVDLPRLEIESARGAQHFTFFMTSNPRIRTEHGAFALNRIKMDVMVGYERDNTKFADSVPGELVDVSQRLVTQEGKGACTTFESEVGCSGVARYRIVNDKESLVISSLSPEGLFADLCRVVFVETESKPWLVDKLEKRVHRLLWLYAIVLLQSSATHDRTPAMLQRRLSEMRTTTDHFAKKTTSPPKKAHAATLYLWSLVDQLPGDKLGTVFADMLCERLETIVDTLAEAIEEEPSFGDDADMRTISADSFRLQRD